MAISQFRTDSAIPTDLIGARIKAVSVIQRRYRAGLRNFSRLYMPLADSWRPFDNSDAGGPRAVAAADGTTTQILGDADTWRELMESGHDRERS